MAGWALDCSRRRLGFIKLVLLATTTKMSHLASLPPEILHHILEWLSPEELVLLRRVSRLFYAYIKGNWSLHRAVYTRNFVGYFLASARPR